MFKIIVILVSISSFISGCKTGVSVNNGSGGDNTDEPGATGMEVQWLKTNAVDVRSVDADDVDFSDLEPLKNAIGDAAVVLLGEQTHGDGTTFLAKVRLIKFLHREMGFDMVAFESGFYDGCKLWLDILAGEDGIAAAGKGIYYHWAYCPEVQPLFRYAAETALSTAPLEIAGVDCKFNGSYSDMYLVTDLENFLSTGLPSAMETENWRTFRRVLNDLALGVNIVPGEEEQEIFYAFLDFLQAGVDSLPGNGFSMSQSPVLQSPAFWKQMLVNIRVQADRDWYQGDKDLLFGNIRDARMADNLLWLFQNPSKGRKIIVWAATMHTLRNPEEIDLMEEGFTYEGFRPMGQVLWENLGQELYSIGFTAYEGKYYSLSKHRVMEVSPAPEGSLDYFMKQAGFRFGFVDFRNPGTGGEWLKQPLVSRPLGNANCKADWSRILDGMFFMDYLEPSNRKY
jgi:erythromycin esterase